jgi:hypothetical protein
MQDNNPQANPAFDPEQAAWEESQNEWFGTKVEGGADLDFTDLIPEEDVPVIGDEDPDAEENKREPAKPPKVGEHGDIIDGDEDPDDEGNEDVPDDEKPDTTTVDKDKKFFTALFKEHKEKGLFSDIDIEEDKEIDEDQYFELARKDKEAGADEIVEALFENMDQDAKDFLQFKKAGGSTEAFLNNYYATFTPELDLTNEDKQVAESNQKAVVRQYLAQVTGEEDPEEIESQISYLKDQGKLASTAKKHYEKLQQIDENNKKAVMQQAEDRQKKVIESHQEFESKIKDAAGKVKTVGDFSFAKTDMKKLAETIYKPTIKVGKNRYITPLQDKIGKIFSDADPSKLLLLAKLIDDDFDAKELVVKATTKETKKAAEVLRNAKSGVTNAIEEPRTKKQLSDYF